MITIFLFFLCLILAALLTISLVYLWKFARIILILQEDFSEVTESLQDAERSIDNCLNLPMFFDSPEVQQATVNALEGVKMAKMSVSKMIGKFTQRSKQKYVEVVEVEKEEE